MTNYRNAILKILPQTLHSLNSTVHLFFSMCCVFFFSVNSFSCNENQGSIPGNVEMLCIPSTVQVTGTEHIFTQGNLIKKLGAPNVFVLKGSTFFVKNDLCENNSINDTSKNKNE